MNMAEKVFEEVRTLPDFELREVLDFVGFLKVRHGIPTLQPANDTTTDWAEFQQHTRERITEPSKAPDLVLINEVRGKVRTGATWSRDELYDRGIR